MQKGSLLPGLIAGVAVLAAFGILAERALRTVRLEAEARVRSRLESRATAAAARAASRLARADPEELAAGTAWRIRPDGWFRIPPEPEPIPTAEIPAGAPDRLLFLLSRGETAEREGDLDSAADFYEQAAGPGSPDELLRVALARLAAIESRRGAEARAAGLWTRVATLAGDTELLPRSAAGGAEVPEDALVAWIVAHLGSDSRDVARGYAGLLGLADHPAVRARRDELRRMGEIRSRLLPLPGEEEPARLLPRDGGGIAVQRGRAVAVLDREEAAALLGPDAVLPGEDAPAPAPGGVAVAVDGTGALADVRFAATAAPAEVSDLVRGQALLLLGAVGIAAGVSGAALFFLLRGARRDAELARLKTEFVANVSHELRTPLSVVRLYAETLKAGRAPAGEEDEYLTVLDREASALSRLVDRVLDFARIEKGEKDYRLEPGDLAAAVREIGEEARGRHPSVDLTVRTPDAPVPASFDREALAGAIGNLVENAAKHAGRGEVLLSVVPNGRTARIEVGDRGPGVPPAEAERIFARFHRGHAAIRGAVRGSGLGLTLVRHAAEGHGGRAGVEDREGGGATFFIEIPTEEGA